MTEEKERHGVGEGPGDQATPGTWGGGGARGGARPVWGTSDWKPAVFTMSSWDLDGLNTGSGREKETRNKRVKVSHKKERNNAICSNMDAVKEVPKAV